MPKPITQSLNLQISLQPKQIQLLDLMESDHSLIGYGGSRGGGKSFLERSVALLRRLKYRGTRALVFRRVYDQLWQQHIMKIAEEWPELYASCWNAENKAIMVPGGGMVLFRYGDTKKDILAFKGQEYDDVFIDEADDLEEDEIKFLCSCCRTTHPTIKPKKVLAFNPGGRGNAYLKRVFIHRDLTEEEKIQNPTFVQAYAWDNVLWVKRALADDGILMAQWYAMPREEKIKYLITRSDYGKELNALPEYLRRPWLYGDFDTFSGQAFETFRRSIHVVEPFTIPDYWSIWGSNDPGFSESDPGVWHLHATDQLGKTFTFREWTFGNREAPSRQARRVAEDTKGMPIQYWVTGMDSWTRVDVESKKSFLDYYHDGGLTGFVKPDHGPGCRVRRCATVREYLQHVEGPKGEVTANWAIFSTCKKLIETIPTLISDPNDPNAVLENNQDHWYDSVGYGLQSRHGRGEEPAKKFKPGTWGERWGDPALIIAQRASDANRDGDGPVNDYAKRILEG